LVTPSWLLVADSIIPTVPKAQQLPQAAWFLIGVQPPRSHQLYEEGSSGVVLAGCTAAWDTTGDAWRAGSGSGMLIAASKAARPVPAPFTVYRLLGAASGSHDRR
jgi:hypothetical protein